MRSRDTNLIDDISAQTIGFDSREFVDFYYGLPKREGKTPMLIPKDWCDFLYRRAIF